MAMTGIRQIYKKQKGLSARDAEVVKQICPATVI